MFASLLRIIANDSFAPKSLMLCPKIIRCSDAIGLKKGCRRAGKPRPSVLTGLFLNRAEIKRARRPRPYKHCREFNNSMNVVRHSNELIDLYIPISRRHIIPQLPHDLSIRNRRTSNYSFVFSSRLFILTLFTDFMDESSAKSDLIDSSRYRATVKWKTVFWASGKLS